VNSLRLSLRNRRDAVSNPHYVGNVQNINGNRQQIILQPPQTIRLLDLAETSGGVGEERKICRCYQGVVRETGSLYTSQTREERFARNPYTVTNVMGVRECDLLDVQAYTKYKDNHRYILSVIYVVSKFLYLIPMKTKSGPFVASAFQSVFDDDLKKNHNFPYGYELIRAKNF